MNINEIKRPWINTQRKTSSPNKFYQSSYWRSKRESFRKLSTLMPNGYLLKNIYCYDCYIETGKEIEGNQCDHDKQKKLEGTEDFSNLRTRCTHHHNIKSAKEGNQMRKQ